MIYSGAAITQQAKSVVDSHDDDVILRDNMADVDVSASGSVWSAVNVDHDGAQLPPILRSQNKLRSRLGKKKDSRRNFLRKRQTKERKKEQIWKGEKTERRRREAKISADSASMFHSP